MNGQSLFRAALLSCAGYAAYACGDAAAKYLTMNGFSPFQVPFLYCLVAIVVLTLFSARLGGLSSLLKTRNRGLHVIRGLLFAPGQILNFYAFSELPMTNVYTILFMMPFLTTILARLFLDERTGRAAWLCILTGFAGVLIVNRPDMTQLAWPIAACVVSTMLAAARNIVARRMGYDETAFSLSIVPCISILCASAVPCFLHGTLPGPDAALVFVLGGLCFAAGTLLVSLSLLQKVRLSLLTPYHYTQIIWGIGFGAVLFGDHPDILTAIGCGLIIASGIALVSAQNVRPLKRNFSPTAASASNPDAS